MNLRPPIIVSLIFLSAAALIVPALAHEGHDKAAPSPFDINAPRKPTPQTAALIGLKTAEVAFGGIDEVVPFSGTVRPRPDRLVIVAAPVSGTVIELAVLPGDHVKKGDAIAVMHSPELARLYQDMLRAEIEHEHVKGELVATRGSRTTVRIQAETAERQARLAEADLAQARQFGDAGAIAQRESAALQARAQADTLKASSEQQASELESLTRSEQASANAIVAMRDTISLILARPLPPPGESAANTDHDPIGVVRLRASTDGVVSRRGPVLGQGVESGQMLVEIVDPTHPQIEGQLPQALADRAAAAAPIAGMPVRIRRADDGTTFLSGVVRSIAPTVDPVTRTVRLFIDADNPDPGAPLRDGAFVDLALVVRSGKHTVVIPAAAVLSDGPARFVFIKEKDSFRKRDIRTGAADDRAIEVLEGLVPGDEVVTSGAYALSQLRPDAPAAPQSH